MSAYLAIRLAQSALPVVRIDHFYGRLSVHLEGTEHTVVYFPKQQLPVVRLVSVCASEVYSSDDAGQELAHAISISHDLSEC